MQMLTIYYSKPDFDHEAYRERPMGCNHPAEDHEVEVSVESQEAIDTIADALHYYLHTYLDGFFISRTAATREEEPWQIEFVFRYSEVRPELHEVYLMFKEILACGEDFDYLRFFIPNSLTNADRTKLLVPAHIIQRARDFEAEGYSVESFTTAEQVELPEDCIDNDDDPFAPSSNF